MKYFKLNLLFQRNKFIKNDSAVASALIERDCTFSIKQNQMRVRIASMNTAMKYPPAWRLLQDIAVNPEVESIVTTEMFEGGIKTLVKQSEQCVYWLLHRLLYFKSIDENGLKALKGDIAELATGLSRAFNQAHLIALKAMDELPGKDVIKIFRNLFIDLLSMDIYDEELQDLSGTNGLVSTAQRMIELSKLGKRIPINFTTKVDEDDYYEMNNEHDKVLEDMQLLNPKYTPFTGMVNKQTAAKKRDQESKKRKTAGDDDKVLKLKEKN
jgi:hypothetical protein